MTTGPAIFTAAELALLGFDVPGDYTRHTWTYPGGPRECQGCGERELLWDDLDFPFDPCPATDLRDAAGEEKVEQWRLDAFAARAAEHEAGAR